MTIIRSHTERSIATDINLALVPVQFVSSKYWNPGMLTNVALY